MRLCLCVVLYMLMWKGRRAAIIYFIQHLNFYGSGFVFVSTIFQRTPAKPLCVYVELCHNFHSSSSSSSLSSFFLLPKDAPEKCSVANDDDEALRWRGYDFIIAPANTRSLAYHKKFSAARIQEGVLPLYVRIDCVSVWKRAGFKINKRNLTAHNATTTQQRNESSVNLGSTGLNDEKRKTTTLTAQYR